MFKKEPPKILMVEDNKSNHPLFQKAFEDAGFAVTILQNADGPFIEQVKQVNPDIVSLDIMIGKSGADLERGGLDALALIRGDQETKSIPVMMLTNFFEEKKVERAKELGAVDFINLQGHAITAIPKIFLNHLHDPKNYIPSHPDMRD